jgi:serine/threonine protein kinase/GTPase SAR1 family protein
MLFAGAKEKDKDFGRLPLQWACLNNAPADVVNILLDPTVQTLCLEIPGYTLSFAQLIIVFQSIWQNRLRMTSLEFDHSRNCQQFVSSAEWCSCGFPQIAAAPNKNWLQLAKTLTEIGKFGSESNDFSRIMLIGRGMAGKSRLVKALKSSNHKSSAIKRENRSIGSALLPLQLIAADGRRIEALVQDCAGQRVAYISHCINVVDECLYVLVWSPFKEGHSNEFATVDEVCVPLFEWLDILVSHAPHSQIVLVGTHLDTPPESDEPAFFVKGHRKRYADFAVQVEARVQAEVARLNDILDHEQMALQENIAKTALNIAELQFLCNDSIKARVHDVMDKQLWKMYALDKKTPRRDRLLAQRIVRNIDQLSVASRRLDILERKPGGVADRMILQLIAHVDSASGTNVKDLMVKLGVVVGNLSFVMRQVPKRWKAIRYTFPAIAARANTPVLSKVQVIQEMRYLDFALADMTDSQLWDGVMFWAGLGVVLERKEQLFHDTAQVLDLIRPLVHHVPSTLLSDLNDDIDSHQLVLASSKKPGPSRDAAQKLLSDLEMKLQLNVKLLDHFTAWSLMNADQREAMLSFLLENSLLCPLRDHTSKFVVTMRLSKDMTMRLEKDDASIIKPEDAPHIVAYLFPVRFIALVPKLMTAIVAFQPERVKVKCVCCDDRIVLTRGESFLVLSIINMSAARVHSNLKKLPTFTSPDSVNYGCVLQAAGNDVGLLSIAAMAIEDVFSSNVLGCFRECWCLHDREAVDWIQFESQHENSVALSLAEAIRMDWNAVICLQNNLRFGDIFPQPRRRVFLVHTDGDGCGEFVRRMKESIAQLSFSTAACSDCCQQSSLEHIASSFKDCGVIVFCISPLTFLNNVSVQALQWALQLKWQQLRHVVIIPVHPAMLQHNRKDVLRSNLVFANGQAWQLQSAALRVLVSLAPVPDPAPSYTDLCPWLSDDQADNWEDEIRSPAAHTSLLTTGFDGRGLVNRMIFDLKEFIDHVVGIRSCTQSPELFDGGIEPLAQPVDWNYVPDGLIDVYPDDVRAQYQVLLQNAATDPGVRRANLESIRVRVDTSGIEPNFSGILTVASADVVASTCGTVGKVLKGGEVYFQKFLNPPKQCYDFISKHCSKICFRDNCLRLHAVCNEPQQPFMLLPWMEPSCRLDLVMQRLVPLPLGERIRIVRRVAQAVRVYHINGFAHGQVCPSKIFLDSGNAPQLCFPGSAVCDLAGKIRWSSPECVAGTTTSASSDVWSLGVLAYALLLGETPFGATATEASIRDALGPAAFSWPPFEVRLCPLPRGLPDAIRGLLELCWHRDPTHRINVTDLADALAALDPTPHLLQPLELPSPSHGYQSMSMFDILRGAMPATTSDADISAVVALAAAKCQTPGARFLMKQRNMTEVEGQSIYIYTTDLIYADFTAAFRSLQTSEILRWSNYSCTLHSALEKLEAPQPMHPKLPRRPEFVVV